MVSLVPFGSPPGILLKIPCRFGIYVLPPQDRRRTPEPGSPYQKARRSDLENQVDGRLDAELLVIAHRCGIACGRGGSKSSAPRRAPRECSQAREEEPVLDGALTLLRRCGQSAA